MQAPKSSGLMRAVSGALSAVKIWTIVLGRTRG